METARVLAKKRATVILAVRNLKKGRKVADRIKSETNNAVLSVMELDLADLQSVHAFAADFNHAFSRLDLLINNAGVMIPPYTKTVDGFELQFGTNHMGHFALTGLLLDRLQKRYAHGIVLPNAVTSNALGLARYAQRLWG